MKNLANITKREMEVLHLISNEYTNDEIARKLYISSHTADSHRKNLFTKLGVRNAAGLVRKAFEERLLTVRSFSLFTLLLLCSIGMAQNTNLDVEGHVKVRGNIDIHNPNDTTSLFIGRAAGENMDFSSPRNNVFLGVEAGELNTIGQQNTFIGRRAGNANTTGGSNTFIGNFAGLNSNGIGGTYIGNFAGYQNTSGVSNTFIGNLSGQANTTAGGNTFLGASSGFGNTTGANNTFLGRSAGSSNTIGDRNTFVGHNAGTNNTDGQYNTFIGETSGEDNTEGRLNTFIGKDSGYKNTTGEENTFVGYQSGQFTETGFYNTFIGNNAGEISFNGSRNTFLGYRADVDSSVPNDSLERAIAIGYMAKVACHNCAVIGGTGADTVNVGINTASPSKRLHVEGETKFAGAMHVSQGMDATSILIGDDAGNSGDFTSNRNNTYVGYQSGAANSTGTGNTYLGSQSGILATGTNNTMLGAVAGFQSSAGNDNTFVGSSAGFFNIDGTSNVFIGKGAGGTFATTSLDSSIAIGYNANVECNNCAVIGDENTNLGIGTTIPKGMVHIEGDGGSARPHLIAKETTAGGSARIRFINTNVDTNFWAIGAKPLTDGNSANANFTIFYKDNDMTSSMFEIFGDGDATLAGMLTENSDERLKTNINILSGVLPKLLQVSGYSYDWKDKNRSESKQIGLMAQEVQKVFPDLVSEDEDGYLSVSYTRFVPLLIAGLQEQENQMAQIKAENAELEDRVLALEKAVQNLLDNPKK